MSLFKRQARRVAAVGVGVGLLVLGLEAPALAVGPTTTGVSPTSGPTGCVVDITVTGYSGSTKAQTDVNFHTGGTPGTDVDAASFSIISDTEIWATVPSTLVAGSGYTIRVDNLLGTGVESTQTFTRTLDAGGRSEEHTSFTPLCGVAGNVFKVTGTNLLGPGEVGGLVEFAPYTGTPPTDGLDADPTNPDISDFTTLQVTVPAGVADGPIAVTTFSASTGGRVQSTTLFATPPPDCPSAVPFARGITLRLRDALVARGKVTASSATAPAGCTAAVPVKIQRRRAGGGWRTVGKTTTSDTGAYRKKIRNRHGKYRSQTSWSCPRSA